MSADAYATVHLTNRSALAGRDPRPRDIVLDRAHRAELARAERMERRQRWEAAVVRVTRFVTRSPRTLTSAAATGGTTRRI